MVQARVCVVVLFSTHEPNVVALVPMEKSMLSLHSCSVTGESKVVPLCMAAGAGMDRVNGAIAVHEGGDSCRVMEP